MDATKFFRSHTRRLQCDSRVARFSGWRPVFAGAARVLFSLAGIGLAAGCILAASFPAAAEARDFSERHYALALATATAGRTEVRMSDGSRCDVLTSTHAIEVEFANKWAESVGQALLYSALTGKPAAVALIIERATDRRFKARLQRVIAAHALPIVVIELRPANSGRVVVERPSAVAAPDLRIPNEDLLP